MPGELVDRRIEDNSDAAGADETQYRGFADVNIPAIDRGTDDDWQYLRDDPDQEDLQS